MGLIFTHESGIVGAYAHIRQVNNRKGDQDVILDVFASKQARADGKPPIATIEAHGAHDLAAEGNVWQKGYQTAKKHDKLKDATDDL